MDLPARTAAAARPAAWIETSPVFVVADATTQPCPGPGRRRLVAART
jgi:hypothetical protein